MIRAKVITATGIIARTIQAGIIGDNDSGDCPLTFENGILNANRILCSGQLLLSASANASWVDGVLYIDGKPWFD